MVSFVTKVIKDANIYEVNKEPNFKTYQMSNKSLL